MAAAWSGWTVSGTTAKRTLPPFNRDQNGLGTTVDSQHLWATGFIHPIQMALGVALKIGERMDVFKLEHEWD